MRKFRSSLTSTAASFTSDDTSKKEDVIMKGISWIPSEKFNYKLKKSVNNTIVTDREKEINQPLRRSIISIESSSKIRLDLNGLELTSFQNLDNSNRLEHISLKNRFHTAEYIRRNLRYRDFGSFVVLQQSEWEVRWMCKFVSYKRIIINNRTQWNYRSNLFEFIP